MKDSVDVRKQKMDKVKQMISKFNRTLITFKLELNWIVCFCDDV